MQNKLIVSYAPHIRTEQATPIIMRDVAIALHETFTHNRVVKIERLFTEENKDFSLLKESDREVILINR